MNRLTLEYWRVGLKRRVGRWSGVFSRCLSEIRNELWPQTTLPEDPYGSGQVRHPAPSTVIDIGGSHGQFAREILHRYPGAVVYSFEPLPECFAELERLAVNQPRLRPFNLALSDAPGEADFNVSAFNDSSSFQPMRREHLEAWPNTAYARTISVRKARLDDLFEAGRLARPIFIKIDVQGHEMAVLRGARRLLAASQRVMLECNFARLYDGQPSFDQLYQELKGLGFRLDGMISPLRHPDTGELLSTDLIFYKPELVGQADGSVDESAQREA